MVQAQLDAFTRRVEQAWGRQLLIYARSSWTSVYLFLQEASGLSGERRSSVALVRTEPCGRCTTLPGSSRFTFTLARVPLT